MQKQILDRLLMSLDVSVEAFAICTVARGLRMVVRGGPEIEVHYILSGTMYLDVPGHSQIKCGPGSVVLVPPHLEQMIGADEAPGRKLPAMEHCTQAANGMLRFDITSPAQACNNGHGHGNGSAGGERGKDDGSDDGSDGGSDGGELKFVCGVINANISGSFGLLDAVRRPIVESLGDQPIVSASYALMLGETQAPDIGSRAVAGALMKTCLLLLLRRHFGHSDHKTSLLSTLRDPRLGKAVTAVLDRPAARHSVAALASVAGMSRSAFAREFSLSFAMSPMEFVAKTRLHLAAEMLRSTSLPVKVIAANIGFSSRSHFSRAFRDGYGADPSAYRRAATEADTAASPGAAPANRHASAHHPTAEAPRRVAPPNQATH